MSGAVVDQSVLPDQTTPLAQSFMLSPPYTPYSQHQVPYGENQTPSGYFTQVGTIDKQMTESELNGSSLYSATCNNNIPCNYDHMTYESDVTTPTYDHMTPACNMPTSYSMSQDILSRPSPLVFTQSPSQFVTTKATPTSRNQRPVLTNQILSMKGHVTHYCSQSSTPSPPVEPHLLSFATNNSGNSMSNDYSPQFQNMSTAESMRFMSSNEPVSFQSSDMPSSAPGLSHVRQSIITETRARYSGAAPINGGLHVSGQKEVGPLRGHTPRSAGSSDSDAETASQSILQWSQWLKNEAPEPVC